MTALHFRFYLSWFGNYGRYPSYPWTRRGDFSAAQVVAGCATSHRSRKEMSSAKQGSRCLLARSRCLLKLHRSWPVLFFLFVPLRNAERGGLGAVGRHVSLSPGFHGSLLRATACDNGQPWTRVGPRRPLQRRSEQPHCPGTAPRDRGPLSRLHGLVFSRVSCGLLSSVASCT